MPQSDYTPFYRSMADHYRVSRDRAEGCLGDIVSMVTRGMENGGVPAQSLQLIADRLLKHYSNDLR